MAWIDILPKPARGLKPKKLRDLERQRSDNFDTVDKECPGQPKKLENDELEALLDQDSCQTQNELTESLTVDRSIISKCLNVLDMIEKQGNWMSYELMRMLNGERAFCIVSSLQFKNGCTTIILSVKNLEVCLLMHQHRWQSRTFMVRTPALYLAEPAWCVLSAALTQ
ncbi:hypothetical protein CDAR_476631 [Caerostris darwini]|uniref:Mariner Mos1 transposase n=1 Tax=Caerostris darwini TaxID=1538125 RepID=A0AAV4V9Z9_9ARAC|nr:hypothetical protein CDAR_476631 [Caerostris darwini]